MRPGELVAKTLEEYKRLNRPKYKNRPWCKKCLKFIYDNGADARLAAKKIGSVSAYHAKECDKWHVGRDRFMPNAKARMRR